MGKTKYIHNPILRGFNPDPSIIRVENDYYIATSTFEWFPGVQIHHSKDLVNWELITRPLTRLTQLDMIGDPDSGGIWAPDISYEDGIFYLAYTNVRTIKSMWRDMHNYLVTANDIRGNWSEPLYLNSVGHDPALFHGEDGGKWFLNVEWEYINGKNVFNGILAQEYSHEKKALVGQRHNIFSGTGAGFTEAPHLYKRNGYYYLLTAEGGTWYDHCVTIARSKNILGPYEIHPENPILTSKNNEQLKLQKAGHGDLIETQDGDWYIVHLCGRPITPFKRCIMGRETAIQRIIWKDDNWPYVENLKREPRVKIKAPDFPEFKVAKSPVKDDFDKDKLDINFQTLRIPLDENIISLKERKSYLRIKGHESLSSLHVQGLVARRQQSFCYVAETTVDFTPSSTRHMAGLVVYYNTENYYYLCVSFKNDVGKNLRLITCNKNNTAEPTGKGVPIGDSSRIGLRIEVDNEKGDFYYSLDEVTWEKIGPQLDMSKLSDDFIGGKSFTGTFVGICCQDMSGNGLYADFDYFKYEELKEN
jgi:xylan 1,4-beta-xylosidase